MAEDLERLMIFLGSLVIWKANRLLATPSTVDEGRFFPGAKKALSCSGAVSDMGLSFSNFSWCRDREGRLECDVDFGKIPFSTIYPDHGHSEPSAISSPMNTCRNCRPYQQLFRALDTSSAIRE